MVAYMITHEAHHRGQVCMLAHQLGFPLPTGPASGIWAWERLWKECGFTHPAISTRDSYFRIRRSPFRENVRT